MSEYWKSNPRKFCDFCKCWIADNKPSVEFHERGKRHKENVQIRLGEMARKGQEDFEAQQQEGDFLKAMEEAALKAYKNDIEQNPDMTGTKISEIATAKNAEIVVGQMKKPEEPKPEETTPVKKWHEAKSPEGYCYYWNVETGASKWEEPEEGFLSIKDQDELKKKDSNQESKTKDNNQQNKTKDNNQQNKTKDNNQQNKTKDNNQQNKTKDNNQQNKTKDNNQQNKTKDSNQQSKAKDKSGKATKEKTSKILPTPPIVYGPTQKAEAYSKWKQIGKDPKSEEPVVDYQLPQIVEEGYYGPEISFKRPEISFKEKTVTLSAKDRGSGGTISFKKRKGTQDSKKSMRIRNDDL